MDINNIQNYEIMTLQELRNNSLKFLEKMNLKDPSKIELNINNNSKNKDEYMKNFKYIIGCLYDGNNISTKVDKLNSCLRDISNKKNDYTSGIYEEYEQMFRYEINTLLRIVKIVEGLFSCPRCSSNKVQSIEKQTRRADEPPTNFCYCTNCKLRWSE